jgi:hypothetical protein
MARGPGKGVSNNPAGRPKGVRNKVTTEVKEMIEKAIHSNTNAVMKDFKHLKGEKRVKYYIELVKIILPRPRDPEEEEEMDRRNSELLRVLFPKRD